MPARRGADGEAVRRGKTLFGELGCAKCHVPTLRTSESAPFPALSGHVIHPYTDLLLHDLGEDLSDDRPSFRAGGRDWRTPPLWGLGLLRKVNGHSYLMHDGRARNAAEAILWHGGEGETSRERFRTLPKPQREDLLSFLDSL